MGGVQLYLRYVGTSVRSQMQYRVSFVLLSFGQLVVTGIEFLAMWALFDRFGGLEGWRLEEVALLYGLVHVAFAVADALGRGFDVFGRMVKSGDFDRLLLRPRGTAFQVAASEVQVFRVGRLAQGLVVLVWALVALDLPAAPARFALLFAAMLGGVCTFLGLFVLQATMSFWTVEGIEVVNVVTYGGVEANQYPLDVYHRVLRRLFFYVVPLAFLNYVPALALLGRPLPDGLPGWVAWISPAVGPLFLWVALRAWRLGVKHYRSTGS